MCAVGLPQFGSVVQSCWLFATPWTTARQASLSITNSWSPPKLMPIELVMPSNHLILCRPLLLLPSIPPSITVFSNESTLCIRWPKYWSFSFNISPSSEHPGLISFRMALCKCRRHRRCGFDPWVRKIPWRRKWQPTPVILSGKSNRQRSLVGYSPWGCKELDMIEHAGTSCDLMAGRILFLILWFTLLRYNYKQTRFRVPITSTWLWLEKNLPQTFSAGIKMA